MDLLTRGRILFAPHGAGGLLGEDNVMLLMPVLPVLLIITILVVTVVARRGVLGDRTREVDVSMPLAVAAAALSLGAAGIHFGVIQEHLDEDALASLFFLVVAWAQVIWAIAFVLRPNDKLRMIGAAGNAIVIVVWLVSRTVGLPIGSTPWQPEAIGIADLFATSFEVVLAGLLSAALVPRLARHVSGYSLNVEKAFVLSGFSVLTVALLTGLALLTPPA